MKADVARLRIETRSPGRPQVANGKVLYYCRECLRCFSPITLKPALEAQISG